MERFAQRESVLLGYSPQISFENSPKKSDANPDMDFSDVFGGPPRRFSVQESRTRYSFGETAMDSEPEDDAAVLSRSSPWSVADEKPVFGAENGNRRTYQGDDFYDDIFRADEIKSLNSPRKSSSWDIYGSSPSSRASSPSRALPAKAEAWSSSVPAQFSLPAKAMKTTDFPPLDSTPIHSPFSKKKDGIRSGLSSSHLYRKSPLSQEVSDTSQVETNFDSKNVEIKLKRSGSKEAALSSGQFHFSIYKWAESGVPLLISLGEGNKTRLKDRLRAADSASNSNGRIESDSKTALNEGAISLDAESVSSDISSGKNHHDSSKEKKAESEDILKSPEPKLSVSEGKDIPQSDDTSTKKTEEKAHSKKVTHKKETYVKKGLTQKTEQKPLHELLNDDNQKQGNDAEWKDNKVKNTQRANDDSNVSNHKKSEAKKRSDVTTASPQKSERNAGDSFGRSRIKGKVGEFVKIFNQDTSEKIKNDFRSHSTRWKKMNTHAEENGASNAVKTDESVQKLNKTKIPESLIREDDNFVKNEVKQESHSKTYLNKSSGLSTNEKNASMFSESLSDNNGIKVEDIEEPLHGYFQVEELSSVEDTGLETNGESDHIQASNTKIQQWSSGRKGNIRSLLSTLQFVLWPESGWKPVPLVDLIEGTAVKRAYQRALLCLHPDKLQQKGAASHQKYIAQQVFEILQEAWDLYNTLGAL